MRPLGHHQRGFLEWTARQGPWPVSGWTWGTQGFRIAESLVKRGLLSKDPFEPGAARHLGSVAYNITPAGRAALEGQA